MQARNWRVADLFELGDGAQVRAELDAYAALAAQARLPTYSWYVPMWRATLALLASSPRFSFPPIREVSRHQTEPCDTPGPERTRRSGPVRSPAATTWMPSFQDESGEPVHVHFRVDPSACSKSSSTRCPSAEITLLEPFIVDATCMSCGDVVLVAAPE